MLVLLCSHPLDRRRPDTDWRREADAVERGGGHFALVHWEPLVEEQDAERAIASVPAAPAETVGVYRGWMLRGKAYRRLHEALVGKRVRLINSPQQYRNAQHLPHSYPALEGLTPRSRWLHKSVLDIDAAVELAASFGSVPAIVRDYARSRKHEWEEACFIPRADDHAHARRVIRNFVERQGPDIVGGIVVREFVELESLGDHPRSGMPLSLEFRTFWLRGEPILVAPLWSNVAYPPDVAPPLDRFRAAVDRIDCEFFAMDVARARDGTWLAVDLGDAQMAVVPDAHIPALHAALHARLG